METEKTTPETQDSSTVDTEQSEITLDSLQEQMKELQALNAELSASNEEIKKRLSGKDKALTNALNEKKKLEQEGMSEAERIKADALAEKQQFVDETKSLLIEAMQLDEHTASLISGETGAEVKEQANILKAYKENILKESNDKIALLEKEIETLKGNMENPGKGNKENIEQETMKRSEWDKLSQTVKMTLASKNIKLID